MKKYNILGYLQIWDYQTKLQLNSIGISLPDPNRDANKKEKKPMTAITALAVNDQGTTLAVALRDDRMVYQFYSLPNLELKQTYYQYSDPICKNMSVYLMEFSPCGGYLGIIDSNHATIVLKLRADKKYEILGKVHVHKEKVLCKLTSQVESSFTF